MGVAGCGCASRNRRRTLLWPGSSNDGLNVPCGNDGKMRTEKRLAAPRSDSSSTGLSTSWANACTLMAATAGRLARRKPLARTAKYSCRLSAYT